ncbi:MAG: sigma-54 dependent transcriptional regulator [Bacteroidales bacterium]|jgi:two-component system response regulator HydG|nr:sigma-54 dependent transcriptional regulator [Bacteroidales bacterium]MDD2830641.1 sigma-54 dependent transcriptional regulator [Bacteroidales bacterium]MDD3207840.1 sigma-54 dependent transcriptional regulator [Bacteroidales bacterium]MDD4472551.1 sigma-54 dependent transcriptional regulator [Bacteroidales bacterium]MDD5045711.1 sigma-54 dependent transcriptional regulator [Bacteroidales bacterium]
MVKILIIEDDAAFNTLLKTWLTKGGFRAEGVLSAGEAMKAVQSQVYDIVLSDLRLPDTDGLTLLKWIRETSPDSAVFIMTGYADIQTAVQAIRLGAADYLEKPVDPVILKEKIDEILRKKDRPHERIPFIKGDSPASLRLYDYMMLVAPTLLSVLIAGESGTGKEYVANHIHQNSSRRDGPFVALDCGAIPRDLASSELFGHLKGSFTSAISDKKGAFEMADGGTLFLDEIGNLSPDVQMQLLRALQEGVIKPVGSSRIVEVNIRIITATNVDLKQMIEQGRFREDLYHRINEFQLNIPRLQERGQDILLFAHHFLEYANRQMKKQITGFSPEAEQLMLAYSWRGNLRELLNVVKRTVLLSEGPQIMATDLPDEIRNMQFTRPGQDAHSLKEQHERQMIIEALARTRNNRTRAARLLGVDRKTLYNKMKLYNLE